ncbi:hypothetical protein VaNZ11_001645, partial [Volvox africanus]
MSVTTRLTDDDVGRGSGQGVLLPLGLSPHDVNCPICVETISDPFVTSCGHTFCYQCISTQLKHKNSCPSCGGYLTADNIYPNFLLNKILRKAATARPPGRCSLLDQVQRLLADNMAPDPPASRSLLHMHPLHHHHHHLQPNGNLCQQGSGQGQGQGGHQGYHNAAASNSRGTPSGAGAVAAPHNGGNGSGGGRLRLRLRDIDAVLAALYEAREELERRESSDALHLLLCFLQDARDHKARQMAELRHQLAVLEEDILAATGAAASGVFAGDDGDGEADTGAVPQELQGEDVVGGMGAPPLPLPLSHHGAVPSSAMRFPDPQRLSPGPSGAWLRRALPHLHDAEGARSGSGCTATAVDNFAASTLPPLPLPQVYTTRQDGPCSESEEDLDLDLDHHHHRHQQRRRLRRLGHRAPPRRASWYLHTITPAGGISSVTIDTSGLHEPGQQAEAFGAAMRHALAAATGGGSGGGASDASASAAAAATGSVSVGDEFDSGGGVRQLPKAPDGDADMDSVGQTPTPMPLTPVVMAEMAREGDESGNAMAAAAAATSTASGPQSEEAEAAARRAEVGASAASGQAVVAACRTRQREATDGGVAGGGGGQYGSSVAVGSGRQGMIRCGSADNFMLLAPTGQTARVAGTLVAATAPTGSQPSASGNVAASGGGEDASALSGAAFTPPTCTTSSDMWRQRQQQPGSPAVAVTFDPTAVAMVVASSCPGPHGANVAAPSGDMTNREAGPGKEDEKRTAEESEDEMDVRER